MSYVFDGQPNRFYLCRCNKNCRVYRSSSITYMLLIQSDNIGGLSIPSPSPHRFHERNLHICKDTWKWYLFYMCVAKSLMFVSMKHLVNMTKRSNLSYYWICEPIILFKSITKLYGTDKLNVRILRNILWNTVSPT